MQSTFSKEWRLDTISRLISKSIKVVLMSRVEFTIASHGERRDLFNKYGIYLACIWFSFLLQPNKREERKKTYGGHTTPGKKGGGIFLWYNISQSIALKKGWRLMMLGSVNRFSASRSSN